MLKAGPEKVGSTLFDKASLKDKELSDSTRIACELVLFLCLDESKGITGKLISAEWDNWQLWPNYLKDLLGSDVYTIRRVVGKDRNFDWGDN
jgi:3-oxoacyl-[acyl-carrier protein] reductase